jgi:hypothetical protein
MPAGTPDAQEPILDEVLARLPEVTSPGQMERLVALALRMLFQRDEDREQLDRLNRSIHESIEQARQRTGPGEFDQELRRIAQECAKLLEAARKSRLSRTVVLHPAERTRKSSPKSAPRPLAAALIMVLVAFGFVPAAAIAIDPSLAPVSWRSAPIVRLTPTRLAEEIAAAGEGETSALAEQGIAVHVARLIDDRPSNRFRRSPRYRHGRSAGRRHGGGPAARHR